MRISLGDATQTWALMESVTVHGLGRFAPRLQFTMRSRTPRENMRVEIHLMLAEMVAGNEVLGHGIVTGIALNHHDLDISLEVPVSRASLEYLDTLVVGRHVDVALRLSGWLHASDNNTDRPSYLNTPAPGEWAFQNFGRARDAVLQFQVARSDWFAQVLEPLGSVDYACIEVPIPRTGHGLHQSIQHVRDAERALREGNDAQVFSLCKASVDALPGAPKEIYEGLPNPHEAKALDELLHRAGNYFHLGRHTAVDGPLRGEFAINHRDAAFALNLAKLLIAQTGRVLDRPPR